MACSNIDDSSLQHARLGHLYYKRNLEMSKKGLIPSFIVNTENCRICMLTKCAILELIHSDLCDLY